MKKRGAVFCVAAALVVLINASVWEGAASVSTGTDLPDIGYYVATNSFPRNTVVDITNLENGKTVRAVVSAPLENPGLLAVLSRDAAGAIGLPNRSIGRIRMNQPADPVAFSRFTEGRSSSGDPDHDPAAFVAADDITPVFTGDEEASFRTPPEAEAADTEDYESIWLALPKEETASASDWTETPEDLSFMYLPEPYVPAASARQEEETSPGTNRAEVTGIIEEGDITGPDEEAEIFPGDYELALIPSEERPPEAGDPVPPAGLIASPGTEVEPAQEGAPFLQALTDAGGDYDFSVPVITELEEGMYYLQLAASRNQYAVKTELAKIDQYLPLKVQVNRGDSYPYRILIGPVNQGESRALLQRFRNSGYQDAFVTDRALQLQMRGR